MEIYDLIAPCKLGLESLVSQELRNLGFKEIKPHNGEIHFTSDALGLARASVNLRTAERILFKLAQFPARTFDELFEGVSQVPWGELIAPDGRLRVMPKCLNSQIMSGRTCQSVAQKAIVEVMKRKTVQHWLPETGAEFKIHVIILNDQVTLALDASGAGLHKRGYRAEGGIAPLRETLAAALVMLSGWKPPLPLFDPFCGSGTILIEAAMIGNRVAPGLHRCFAAEDWPFIESFVWAQARAEAESKIRPDPFMLYGSDIEGGILSIAKSNAKEAGVGNFIRFEKKSFDLWKPLDQKSFLVTNPPYGERLQDVEQAEGIYRKMGQVFKPDSTHYFILTPHPDFQKLFDRRAKKNRKLYNGKIRCYLYEYP